MPQTAAHYGDIFRVYSFGNVARVAQCLEGAWDKLECKQFPVWAYARGRAQLPTEAQDGRRKNKCARQHLVGY